MQTQITCPRCQTPFVADVHQIIDVGQQPQMKELLLTGYLNVAQCPNCGAVTQVTTPLLYHDPENELFLVYVPMEMALPQAEQERLIGQLVQRAMDQLPPEQRRGYMLQPQTIISMQSLLERVLETEGVTPEMLARQRAQAELLQTLLGSDKAQVKELIRERGDEIDETFFAMLRAMLNSAENEQRQEELIKLSNLQARLYSETEVGRRLERQQQALHAFNRDVKKEDNLTPKLLLKHVLANREDDQLVEALVAAGQPAFNYEFFVLLSDRIEKREKAGLDSSDLVALRERLLALQQEFQERSREMFEKAQSILRQMIEADDRAEAVRRNVSQIDDTFMYVLAANIARAEQSGNKQLLEDLQAVQALIWQEIESEAPPEIRLINKLLRARQDEDRRQLLTENAELVTPQLLEILKAISQQAEETEDTELDGRIRQVEALVEARLELQ